jgi:transposase InsO family protein
MEQNRDTISLELVKRLQYNPNESELKITDNLLLIRASDGIFRVYVPAAARLRILDHVHGGTRLSGHQGRDRTLNILRREYWWPGMAQQTRHFVQSCLACTIAKTPVQRATGLERISRTSAHPFDIVAMDFVGPLPETGRGNKFLLTWIDTFSNWSEAVPVPDVTSATLAEALYESLLCRHGVPNYILTDRGRQFVGNMNRILLELIGAKHMTTTAYSPNANGICERMHRYLGEQFRTLSSNELKDWDKFVPAIMFTFRNGISKATGNSPYFIIHGRDPKLPDPVLTMDTDELNH